MRKLATIALLGVAALGACKQEVPGKTFETQYVTGTVASVETFGESGKDQICIGLQDGTSVNVYCQSGDYSDDKTEFSRGMIPYIKTEVKAHMGRDLKLEVAGGKFYKIEFSDGNYNTQDH